MNWPTTIIGVALAGAAGYFAEPTLRPTLTGEKPVPKKHVVAKQDTPPAADPVLDPTPAPVVEPKADPTPEPPPAPPVEEPKTDPVPPPVPPEPKPEPPPTPKPDPLMVEPGTPAEPKAEEPKKEEPKEEESKEDSSGLKLNEEQIVKAMQRSFHSGNFKEFSADKASAWKATAPETIGGEKFQTGLVDYTAETIFGPKTVQAKALIQDGVVVKWISPKSGMEIK